MSIPAAADARAAASRAGKAAARGELSAKPKQAERISTLWKSTIKNVAQVGAPARSIFSAHGENSSV